MNHSTKALRHKTLGERIDSFINNESLLKDALIGISVRSGSGKILYNNLGNKRFHPASNMKLISGAAAFSVLGKDYSFETEIRTDGLVKGNTLYGNLYLKGKGDPTLLPADFDRFAEKVRTSGIKTIEGDIIGDDSWYDDVRLSSDLNWNDEHFYYGAQVSALTVSPNTDYDAGSVMVEVSPGQNIGDKPIVSIAPKTDYITIVNEAKTGGQDDEEDIIINRKHGTNTITIKGVISIESPIVKEWIAVWEPTYYALNLFQQALVKEGITWNGKVKDSVAPKKGDVLFLHQSMPLSDLFVPFMKLSNNGHAEILVKEMGKVVHGEGSWEKGLEVVETELASLGMNTETLLIRDGSGISHVNLIPPNEISKLLYTVQDKEWFPLYLYSLPVAGIEERMVGGTLTERMGNLKGRVQAKTGTIYGVSTLSGFVNTESGEQLIFSIMINNLLDEDKGPDIIDEIVKIIAEQ